jgi:PAS domain S-box-containing protein
MTRFSCHPRTLLLNPPNQYQRIMDGLEQAAHPSSMECCREGIAMVNELSRLLDALPGLVWTALPNGQIDFLNQRWCEYTGLSVDQGYRSGWETVIHPEDLPEFLERWKSIRASGDPGEMEARVRRFDGEYRWFLFRACTLLDSSGQGVKWCGTTTDVDDRRRSRQTPPPSDEGRLRMIIDTIPTIAWCSLPDGSGEFWNQRWHDYTGLSPEAARGWGWQAVVHPEDMDVLTDKWRTDLAAGKPGEVEGRLRRFDGEYRWFLFRYEPLRDVFGTIVNWYGTNTDIEDRRQAEALLAGEKRLLEMVAGGHSITEILDALCQLVERTAAGCYCSVVLVDSSGEHLEHGVAPSLPVSFLASILGRPVNADSGPCAMAAYLNEQVISADLSSETRWAAYEWCPMAMTHGLQACWSTPISSTKGKVLGAFAIYYDRPRTPTSQQQALIDRFTHIASIAIERARSDTALKGSEARKTAILQSAIDCIVTIDHKGCITEFNPAAERTFGYRRDGVMGKQLADVIIPPSLRERHRQAFARYLATGEARVLGRRLEMNAVRADGKEFPAEIAITRIPLDGLPCFTGFLRDITERRQSEEALRRSQAFLAQAQHVSSTGGFFWHPSTDEITWSEEVYRIFGLDPTSPVTLDLIFSRLHPEDIPSFQEMLIRQKREGGDFQHEHRLLMPDKSVKYLQVVAHATQENDRLKYVAAVQDVTERRRSDEALGKLRSELAHAARVMGLGTMTASIAHEVNQPLSGIITNASTCLRMLAADPPNIDGARETARRTIRDGNRASDVITRLRALFSKKAAISEAFDLNEATREVIALSLTELQRNRVVLQSDLGENLPAVTGDRVQVQQVILNLLRNASDAMKNVDSRPRWLLIRTEPDGGDCVRLSVRDAGAGFEPESVERLFEPFYTTKSDGMGIGLSVSRSIVERHNGRLWAVPNKGPGVTFSFSIPRRPVAAMSADRVGAVRAPAVSGAA